MNLKSLPDTELLRSTKEAVHAEKLCTLAVLNHLREIEVRRLFLKYGYNSLFEMATKHFGYCAGSAQIRISSMRLMRDVPEVCEHIETGKLSLTNAAQLQSFFKRASLKPESRTEMITDCLNKSTREVEKTLIGHNPEADRRDDIRFTDNDRLRLSITISEKLFQKLEKLKHRYKLRSTEAAIEMMADSFEQTSLQTPQGTNASLSLPASEVRKRYIPAVTKKIVIRENKSQGCVYEDPKTKSICGGKVDLQVDHIHPHSCGGSNIADNLRLLCAHHNRVAWYEMQKPKYRNWLANGASEAVVNQDYLTPHCRA